MIALQWTIRKFWDVLPLEHATFKTCFTNQLLCFLLLQTIFVASHVMFASFRTQRVWSSTESSFLRAQRGRERLVAARCQQREGSFNGKERHPKTSQDNKLPNQDYPLLKTPYRLEGFGVEAPTPQVKLMFEAPDPTIEEIWIFRQSVQERVSLLGSALGQENGSFWDWKKKCDAEICWKCVFFFHKLIVFVGPFGTIQISCPFGSKHDRNMSTTNEQQRPRCQRSRVESLAAGGIQWPPKKKKKEKKNIRQLLPMKLPCILSKKTSLARSTLMGRATRRSLKTCEKIPVFQHGSDAWAWQWWTCW